MQRRQAIIAAIGAIVGIMSGKVKSEPLPGTSSAVSTSQFSVGMQPQSVTFNFDTYAEFTFQWKGQFVTVSGEEMFAALKSH